MTEHVTHTEKETRTRWHPCYPSFREWLDNEAPIEDEPTPRTAKARNKARMVRVRRV